MQIMRWLSIAAGVFLIVACFFPWVTIESKSIVVSGVDASATSFGKPGYMHLLLGLLAIILILTQRIIAQRISIFLTAFNAAWAIRNFIVISMCQGGECPVKHAALYIVLISSFVLLLFNLLTGTKEKQ